MPEELRSQELARDPQALSSEYHKARKQLMLWAGILFIWELVGIDLEKAKEAGGNATAIITAIKSPQAIPWVMLILVAYFLFKTNIEWFQCNASRRRVTVSRVDLITAWVITLLAYALYVGQTISHIQVADRLEAAIKGDLVWWSMLGIAVGGDIVWLIWVYVRFTKKDLPKDLRNEQKLYGPIAFSLVILASSLVLWIWQKPLKLKAVLFAIGQGIIMAGIWLFAGSTLANYFRSTMNRIRSLRKNTKEDSKDLTNRGESNI